MLILPEKFVVQKFYQYSGAPKYNKYNHTYVGSCNICREGTHWLSKKRLYYLPKRNQIFCHNCGYSNSPINWIIESSGCTFADLRNEVQEIDDFDIQSNEKIVLPDSPTLPIDCINLFDPNQIDFYRNNKIVKQAIKVLKKRHLLDAENKPSAFYLSLTDFVHKNRLIIPFFDENHKIVHYQSRSILDDDYRPRYLSKGNSEKTLFNFDNVRSTHDTVYIFEGPLNSCFVNNGIAVAGIQDESYQIFTERQQKQINQLYQYKTVWILDSQWIDNASLKKSFILNELNQNIFIWPEKIGKKFKDFNDLAIATKKSSIKSSFIDDNTYTGAEAKLLLTQIKLKR